MKKFSPGILYGKELLALYEDAKKNEYALPAVNVSGTNTINAALEAAAAVNSPIIIQFSFEGAGFITGGRGLLNDFTANVRGAVSGALHVHNVVAYYGIPVVLHTDHANDQLLPWVLQLIAEGEKFYAEKKFPLFSSHMTDLSAKSPDENLEISGAIFKQLVKLEMGIEIELGVTGGIEGNIDNSRVASETLYTLPGDVALAYSKMNKIGRLFTIAAAFGNVHGIYAPGHVELKPVILNNCQQYIRETYHTEEKPAFFVFHGGSGSSLQQSREAIQYGCIKMNIDTDLQWAFWEGVKNYYNEFEPFLQSQLGNPGGSALPNKKYYEVKSWMRPGEKNYVKHLEEIYSNLNCINRNG